MSGRQCQLGILQRGRIGGGGSGGGRSTRDKKGKLEKRVRFYECW